ncbi:4-phosphopantetheinyl transferase family protein [Aquitalea sp. S1-19]|nr:4-phosphopantetheinyl transferase family protein [Aquitalea sp. S1-19]MCP9760496.1 4-phosphopantetheinyl transferase family protein [Aquitalea sp. S1-19]
MSLEPLHGQGMSALMPDSLVLAYEAAPDFRPDARRAARQLCQQLISVLPWVPAGVSRSSTAGWCCVGLCQDAAVGIDVEQPQPGLIDAGMLELILHPDERPGLARADQRACVALWTRKEACLKLMGTGLEIPPSTLWVGWPTASWQRLPQGWLLTLWRGGVPLSIAADRPRPLCWWASSSN